MSLDRLHGNELVLTHEQVSIFLGARRESISTAAQKLELTGAIRHRRGHLTVANRQELEHRAGESYAVVSRGVSISRANIRSFEHDLSLSLITPVL
jgi:hypothetical protein